MKQKLVTVLFSGGIDSTACVRFFTDRGYTVRGVFVNFGQSAVLAKAQAVEELKAELGIPVAEISAMSECSFGTGELVGRNAFLISAPVLLGNCREGLLAIGVHAGTPYYDCSAAFIEQINGTRPRIHRWTSERSCAFY